MIKYAGPIFVFLFFFSAQFSTYEARIQIVAWTLIKVFEKGIWTSFVVGQAHYFEKWSHEMVIKDPHLEGIVYVCIIPIIMNAFMFFMFSRISRLDLPCLTVRSRVSETSQHFDIQEAVKVGI